MLWCRDDDDDSGQSGTWALHRRTLARTQRFSPPKTDNRRPSGLAARESPDTRILFMSGYTDAAIASEGVFEPNIAFLQKPFGLSVLTRKVREVLDGPPWRAGVPVG